MDAPLRFLARLALLGDLISGLFNPAERRGGVLAGARSLDVERLAQFIDVRLRRRGPRLCFAQLLLKVRGFTSSGLKRPNSASAGQFQLSVELGAVARRLACSCVCGVRPTGLGGTGSFHLGDFGAQLNDALLQTESLITGRRFLTAEPIDLLM